ncbi:hypothetical protein Y1Q_0022417 [Alligator mississippiensis]|uniref:Uncharacterized protein n=1 Tax=Alligator mississippiensis TaxID=8496 RepID=A0A151N0B5_ALLMI|nr:hypothetical protein Y1Q_0022417 [Alligator mississippiensis]
MVEEWLAGSWVWSMENTVHEWERDRLLTLKVRHITLLKRMLEAQEQQVTMVARAVKAVKEDHLMLDSILALEVTFVSPTTQPLALALPAPWQLPAAQLQASQWA